MCSVQPIQNVPYIGHTGRQIGERLKEHKSLAPSRKLSAVAEHFSTTGHIIDWENTKVLDREDKEYPARCGRPFTSKRRNLHWTVTKDWSYRPYIMDSSDWRRQGHKEVNNPHNNIGFLLMRTSATCRKFKVCEFSPSAESLFKSFLMFSTSTYELTFDFYYL